MNAMYEPPGQEDSVFNCGLEHVVISTQKNLNIL